jgi:cation:H+ antiporter
VFGVGVWPLVIAAVYLASLLVVHRGDEAMRWAPVGGPTRERGDEDDGARRPPVWRVALSGAVILVAGWVLARSGDRLAESPVLDATFVGAGLVALATSLPEVSTVIGSIRTGAYDMAVSNIVGTNSLEVALLLLADAALRDGPLLSFATSSDIFLAALASVLTCLYLGGLLLRHDRDGARLGRDSIAVIVVYAAGMLVLSFG